MPGFTLLLIWICFVLPLRAQEREARLSTLQQAVAHDSTSPDLHYQLALLLHRLGRIDSASIHYAAAIRTGTARPEPYFYLGMIHLRRGEMATAQRLLADAVRISPEDRYAADALHAAETYLTADSALAAGDDSLAAVAFQRFLSFYPEDAKARQKLEAVQLTLETARSDSATLDSSAFALASQPSVPAADSLFTDRASSDSTSMADSLGSTLGTTRQPPTMQPAASPPATGTEPANFAIQPPSDADTHPPTSESDSVAGPSAAKSSPEPQGKSGTATGWRVAAIALLVVLAGSGWIRRRRRGNTAAPKERGRKLGSVPKVQSLGRYELDEEIGRGAMGVVYKAWDPRLERWVVLKTLLSDPDAFGSPAPETLHQRFLREARAVARLAHPNIVTLYDVFEEGREVFLAMEYIEGRTLEDLLSEHGRLPPRRALALLHQVALALDYAHRHGVVHRDIKPANIMVEPGDSVKVMDFGVAKLPSSTLTQAGELLGTPYYMAPEQIEGQNTDGRADIFAAGVVLYECLTGHRPFEGDSIPAIFYDILHSDPPPLCRFNPALTSEFDQLVHRALAREVGDRYATAKEFAEALATAQESFRTETIVLIEIGNAGQLMERLGKETARLLFARFERAAVDALSRYRVESLKSTGDGILAIFSNADEAIGAAIDIYRAVHASLEELDPPHPAYLRGLRGSIHVGDTRLTQSGDRLSEDFITSFLVLGVSEKDRVAASEHPGATLPRGSRLLLTGAAYTAIAEKDRLPIRRLGLFAPRNAMAPEEILLVLWNDQRTVITELEKPSCIP